LKKLASLLDTGIEKGIPFGASSIGTDNNTSLSSMEIFSNPSKCARLRIQIIHWYVKEALDLRRMEIHRDDMVTPSSLQHIRNKLGRDRCSTLVFLVLARVWEVRDDRSDASGAGGLAGVDHDEEFHEAVIDVTGSSGLKDEYYRDVSVIKRIVAGIWEQTIFISYTLAHCNAGLLVGIVQTHGLCEVDSQPVCRCPLVIFLISAFDTSLQLLLATSQSFHSE
jgi:hypothetical protein